MNIRDLEYLVAVHDMNNFSRAAELCNVSQPTLSGQLKKLEVDLDASLMERSTRRVLFTPVGKSVVEHARNVLSMVDKIHDLASVSEDPTSGDFNIGLLPSVGPFLLPKLMPTLTKKYPKMNLFLYELQKNKLIDKLLAGDLDAVIVSKKKWSSTVKEIPLYKEKLLLATSSDDVLSKETEVDKKALKGRQLLMLEDGYCLRDEALQLCTKAGIKEDHRFKATSIDTLLHMVKSSKGVTLIPELACDQKVEGLSFVNYNSSKAKRDIVMLTRKDSFRNESLELLAQAIKETVDQEFNLIDA